MNIESVFNTCVDNSKFMQLPDELQIKILAELPIQDLLKSTVVMEISIFLLYIHKRLV